MSSKESYCPSCGTSAERAGLKAPIDWYRCPDCLDASPRHKLPLRRRVSVVRDQTTSGGHVPPTALVNSTISGADSVSTQWAGNNVGEGTTGPTPDLSSEIDEAVADDGTSWIRSPGTPLGGTGRCHFGLNSTIGANVGSWRIAYRALRDSSGSGPSTFRYTLYRSDGLGEHSPVISTNDLTTSWATYTTTINFVGGGVADNANSISITVTAGGNNRVQISRLEVIG